MKLEASNKNLYDPRFEQDSCGVGFLARPSDQPSHQIVELALQAVVNLAHRGALDADARTGDGAGVLLQIPRRFFHREVEKLGVRLEDPDKLAVAMVFLPQEAAAASRCQQIIERAATGRGLQVLGWRDVPVETESLGDKALSTRPVVKQLLALPPSGTEGDAYERLLYLVRKEAEAALLKQKLEGCYIPSFSHRTLVYKGLVVSKQLRAFYLDLQDTLFESALAIFHQRYSTNTFPTWPLAQPFRMLAHNGEINTLQGNVNWMRAREPELHSQLWGDDIERLKPIVVPGGSDSAMLDNVLEAMVLSGRDLLHAMLMLTPEAWERMPDLDPAWRDFYEYHACLMEPWDGPAALAFTDGSQVGASLDRNGLRPLRYKISQDGLVVAGSEVGLVEIDDAHTIEKGRLAPGEMLVVDIRKGRILRKQEIMELYTKRQPYGKWVRENVRRLALTPTPSPNGDRAGRRQEEAELSRQQTAFAYTNEDIRMILKEMATKGHDAVWSMGDDVPLAVLSQMHRPLMFYFKQRFAQVTNPPIDPLREELVMSLDCYVGPRQSAFEETGEHARVLYLDTPLLMESTVQALKKLQDPHFRLAEISVLFPVKEGEAGLEKALGKLCARASEAIDSGHNLLLLSDRGVNAEQAAIPMLLAVGAVHHHLIREGKRMKTDILVETGAAWDIHHIALLLGYGANGVYPYLALETVYHFLGERGMQGTTVAEVEENFRMAVDRGLLKIMSKMGISAIRSYRGAQIFEIIGISEEVVERCFTGTPARLGGIGLQEIAEDVLFWHRQAFDSVPEIKDIGYIRYRKEGEYHGFNPEVVKALQRAVVSGDYAAYREYSHLVHDGPPRTLRDILTFNSPEPAIPLDEVEPVSSIVKRFVTAAMSMGALSPNAHKTLASAMNRLGARSNTGEGGEDPRRYKPDPNGDSRNSAIKQVASGRFGV
ncbi:MAG TPA: glutamate synthase large subunit, partial [Dehalococcoidia bacterium]|nr:glutamate synthase large subunit [Dehalococcoidia bacterium]